MTLQLSEPLEARLNELARSRGQSVEAVLEDLLAGRMPAAAPDFFDFSAEMLCIASTDGRFLRLNRAFCAALGYSEEQLLATPFIEFVHPADVPATLNALEGLRQGRTLIEFTNRHFHADGTLRWLSWTSTPLPDGRIYAVARDITRQKQLEADLVAQNNAIRTVLESITDAFFALDSNWRFTYLNTQAGILLRRDPAALMGVNVWEAFPDAVDSDFDRYYRHAAATGEVVTFVAFYEPLNTWFEVRAYPLEQGGIAVYFRDVNARLESETILHRRAQEFRALVENNPELIGRADRQMRFIYVNPALRRQLRLGPDAPAEIAANDLNLPAATREYLVRTAEHVFATGEECRIEFEVTDEHETRYYEARVVPEFGPDGAVETILTISRNISERRRIEQALRESEALYRAIVESQIDMICRYHPDTTLIYANDAYCRFFGQTREEILGTSYLPRVAPETHEPIRERIAHVLRDPRPEVRVFPAFAADGSKRWIQWVDHGIMNQNGEVVMIQAVGRDITPLKEAEAALQHREEQYRRLFENNPLPMWVYDPATLRIMAVNEAAVNQYGYSRDEFLALIVTDLSIPEDQARLARTISQLRPGMSAPRVWRQVRKDGTTMDMEVSGHDIVFEGRPARMALARDITQARQLEEQRIYTQTLEMELNKQRELAELRERFMSMVSHEFRTPLAIISTSVNIVQNYFDKLPREKFVERLDDINEQIQSMVRLLEDVLSILRGNAGKLPFQPEIVDIVALCRRTVDNIRLTDQGQHYILFETEKPSLYMEADQRLLEHIFTNLISNAVKYTVPGKRVIASITTDETSIIFTVQDEGIGIPEADQTYVFQPFHRGRNAAGINGTGLGLAIVRQNVELHGGQIMFRSVENEGTTFTVRLPRYVHAASAGNM